ncbi:hypothetical protein O181_045445 [Austropuccinia psidii MF-1]|uniref:Uncharacterized protein n=1 Tax=Austropuccinia psidii MF-1 TaxID=1389203 RepID=A0A9Q3DRF8_9BASI|nr:hypothetical protein [Austropuccinia psidii MF-1]
MVLVKKIFKFTPRPAASRVPSDSCWPRWRWQPGNPKYSDLILLLRIQGFVGVLATYSPSASCPRLDQIREFFLSLVACFMN